MQERRKPAPVQKPKAKPKAAPKTQNTAAKPAVKQQQVRAEAEAAGEPFNPDSVFFHEAKPAAGAWTAAQVVDFMIAEPR